MWNKWNCMVFEHCLALPIEIGMKTDLFQSCDHCWFYKFEWHIACSTLTTSSFGNWNSSVGIPLPPLALFVVMLTKALLTSHSRMFGSRWVTTPSWLSRSLKPFFFLIVFSVFLLLLLFDLWVGKIPWRREWLPTPVFLPEEFYGQRSLVGSSPYKSALCWFDDCICQKNLEDRGKMFTSTPQVAQW